MHIKQPNEILHNTEADRVASVDQSEPQKQIQKETYGIKITDIALTKAIETRKSLAITSDYMLQLKLNAGGCSGFTYEIDFINPSTIDKTQFKFFEYPELTICCNKNSYLFLIGTEIDWQQSIMMTGFTFKIPQATHSCGCGKSISF